MQRLFATSPYLSLHPEARISCLLIYCPDSCACCCEINNIYCFRIQQLFARVIASTFAFELNNNFINRTFFCQSKSCQSHADENKLFRFYACRNMKFPVNDELNNSLCFECLNDVRHSGWICETEKIRRKSFIIFFRRGHLLRKVYKLRNKYNCRHEGGWMGNGC